MAIATRTGLVLERLSQEFVNATSEPPFLYELTPAEARKVLDDVQAAPVEKLRVEERWVTVPAEVGDVNVRIVRPPNRAGTLPVILYGGRRGKHAESGISRPLRPIQSGEFNRPVSQESSSGRSSR